MPLEKWLAAADCTILSHFLINCKTIPGGGADLRWVVTVSGQNSSAPTTNYAPPVVQGISNYSSGALVTHANTDGGDLVEISGLNFGPTTNVSDSDGAALLDGVTFGPQGQQYAAKRCKVTVLSTKIQCQMPAGIGRNMRWHVMVAGQTSELSAPLVSYASPVVRRASTTRINTAGQAVTLSGHHFGLRVPDIQVHWMFGSHTYPSLQYAPASPNLPSDTFITADHSRVERLDNVVVDVPPLEDFASSRKMVNVSTLLVLRSGATTMVSNSILVSYLPPQVIKVFTYEGATAALRVVIEGDNFCGSTLCGQVEITSSTGSSVSVSKYVHWTHTRIEFEIPIDKGSFVVAVGSGADDNIGFQRSNKQVFEHMSPVIDNMFIEDNNGAKRPGPFATRGGDVVTIEGRYFRMNNVQVWVARKQSPNVISISQDLAKGPHFYKVVALMPEGQGLAQPLRVVLPSIGEVAPADSEPVAADYSPPSELVQNLHNFATRGASVTFTGTNIGTCVYLVVDGVTIDTITTKRSTGQVVARTPVPCTNVSRSAGTPHDAVTLSVPEGDGTGHVLSVSAGGQVPDPFTGWKSVSTQCNLGKAPVATGMDRFGWFDYNGPVVESVAPSSLPTSAEMPIVIFGHNFGVTRPKVIMFSRKSPTACACSTAVDALCKEGVGCTASVCCGNNGRAGCGCYTGGCQCCTQETTCDVVRANHTHIVCTVRPGQGGDLEVSVNVNGQVSGGGVDGDGARGENTFSFTPPSIASVFPLSSPTRGGVLVTVVGTSFGIRGATVKLLGDAAGSGIFARDIGPIPITFQNHTHITFEVPEGHGQNRAVQVTVGGQHATHTAFLFSYHAPTFTRMEQPAACTARVRTTNCGSPTVGGFPLTLHGENLGGPTMLGLMRVIVEGRGDAPSRHICCDTCSNLMSLRSSFFPTGGGDEACACCVQSQDHEVITILAPEGVGRDQPVELTYDYANWVFKSSLTYDAPYVNFINPQVGDANGDTLTLHGINFGAFGADNVSFLSVGNWTCTNVGPREPLGIGGLVVDPDTGLNQILLGEISWAGTGPSDEAIVCTIGNDPVGPKDVEITVAGQTSRWSRDEWTSSAGHRLYRSECPANWHGMRGEPCFECPFVTDETGRTILDPRGDKQYMGACGGGIFEPKAKQGFFLSRVFRTCGDSDTKCVNITDCSSYGEDVACSYEFAKGAEYCNKTMKLLRASCTYILSCEPAEACEAENVCSVIPEGASDPDTGKAIEARGYANVSLSTGEYVERCSACAVGYFRVGGLCELCPTNIVVIAAAFVAGIVMACIGAYILHLYQVNLAMAAIGVDYAQVMSMFLKSDIRWPGEIRVLFRALSALNFDLDIASPECLLRDIYRYDLKWYGIMCLPLGCALIFFLIHLVLWSRKKFWLRRRRNLNKHTHAMVSMNLVMMYFLYLYLTRSALDVFNCVPLDPPDKIHPDWTYMTAVGGVRCYESGSLQMQLLPFAVLGIIFYTLGYPALLAWLLWRNKARIREDQVLRANGKGDKRVKGDMFNIYNIRKRYSAIYYQFKPRAYYWVVIIIARKFAIAAINLMLRTVSRHTSFAWCVCVCVCVCKCFCF